MDINRNNYEAFLLDLLEGRLSSEEEQELNAFLTDHPEFVSDLPDLDLFKLEKKSMRYPDGDLLKKEFPVAGTLLSDSNFDMFSIGRMEGDLSPAQEQEHRSLVEKDESKRKEWQEWQKTMLVAEQLSFPGRKALKRNPRALSNKLWLGGLAVAATLTLLLFLLRMESSAPGLAEDGPSESLPTQVETLMDQELITENQETTPPAVEEITKPRVASTVPGPSLEVQESLPQENTQPISEEIRARPLRIAGSLSGNSAIVGQPSADRIKPLTGITVSAKTSRLPLNEIAELDRQMLFNEFTKEHNISILTVANAGIKGINKLTGSDISLMASRDEEGEVSGFRLKSKRFSLTRPLARNEAEE
jgi:hypothetical protein